MIKMPLGYPAILKQRIAEGDITRGEAIVWLTEHGVRTTKARELLREASE